MSESVGRLWSLHGIKLTFKDLIQKFLLFLVGEHLMMWFSYD
jgi:hypothetical protein